MDNTATYPDIYEQGRFGLQLQMPSYQTEFPHDLPFDPGATSSLFELNYFPSTASRLLLLIPIALVLLVFFFRKHIQSGFGHIGFLIGMILVFFGPLRLPSFFPFNTTLGLVKAIGLLLTGYAAVLYVLKRVKFDLFEIPSLARVGVYIISLLLSVFVMTNPSFFIADFGIVLTGVLFFILGFIYFTWSTAGLLITTWARLLAIAGIIVLTIFIDRGVGAEIISLLFQKYENFVFLHDLSRGRIFSIIDFEYFIPCVAIFIVGFRLNKQRRSILEYYIFTTMSFVAILLVNYRYRFLTYVLGLISISLFTKTMAKAIRKHTIILLVILSTLYFGYSIAFFRSTILDRFLVRNYSEDQVSIDRRLVMYQQAWELFQERPILGVGLGNYKDNVQIVYSRFGGRTYEPYYKILQNVYAYPHNWFLTVLAENGIVGFVVLMWMLGMFLVMDIRLYQKLAGDRLLVFVTLSTIGWLYVFANLFTMMHVSLPMVIVFWACRGMIERIHHEVFPQGRKLSAPR
ncbi:O-antigen ligase family protein [Candidatus Gottesmanbacteria bacterium]|nr:O-antigen ligase family protein [Candidatus Gottesmanbacteria bacterium]